MIGIYVMLYTKMMKKTHVTAALISNCTEYQYCLCYNISYSKIIYQTFSFFCADKAGYVVVNSEDSF